jgi:hypothetical protein
LLRFNRFFASITAFTAKIIHHILLYSKLFQIIILFSGTTNYGECATIKSQAGPNSFKISAQDWVTKTSAIGLRTSAGRYGGAYAHKDIAFEFGMRMSFTMLRYLQHAIASITKAIFEIYELKPCL